jgi:hypothetical protein
MIKTLFVSVTVKVPKRKGKSAKSLFSHMRENVIQLLEERGIDMYVYTLKDVKYSSTSMITEYLADCTLEGIPDRLQEQKDLLDRITTTGL